MDFPFPLSMIFSRSVFSSRLVFVLPFLTGAAFVFPLVQRNILAKEALCGGGHQRKGWLKRDTSLHC